MQHLVKETFFAGDFGHYLAAIRTDHIAMFLANIFGAANLAYLGAWFPDLLANGAIG